MSIPISKVARVTPAVIAAGGNGVTVIGLLLTANTSVPLGMVESFYSALAVANYFGSGSAEAAFAGAYFRGNDGAGQQPGNLLIAQFPLNGVPAYLLGATLATPLVDLTGLAAGTMTIDINGAPVVSANINLGAATSYSNIASIIQTAFNYADATATASAAGTTLTVTAVATGEILPGQPVTDVAGTHFLPGTTILSQLTGAAGGIGTYQLSQAVPASVSSESVTLGAMQVTYDSQLDAFLFTLGTPGTSSTITVANAGTIATALKLTAAAGAEVSEGAGAAVPATFMNAVIATTANWVTFSSIFEPTDTLKEQFAAWNDAQGDDFAYIPWSTEAQDIDPNAVSGAYYAITQAGYDGVYYSYAPVNKYLKAAFIMGAAASIDFNVAGGRQNFAFLTQYGLAVDVVDSNIYDILLAKGINSYCEFSERDGTLSNREYPGAITGEFLWMDSYINQVWLNNGLQGDLFNILKTNKNLPYTTGGYARIKEGLSGTAEDALTFGAIQAGVTLSSEQIVEVNTQAGIPIADELQSTGWQLVIKSASPQVRAARGSPPILFFYTDGQSVQALNLTSTEVQ